MEERNRMYYQSIARLSILTGGLFSIAAVVLGLLILDGNTLGPKLMFFQIASNALPSLIGGFLLMMAGLILNAVVNPPIE